MTRRRDDEAGRRIETVANEIKRSDDVATDDGTEAVANERERESGTA